MSEAGDVLKEGLGEALQQGKLIDGANKPYEAGMMVTVNGRLRWAVVGAGGFGPWMNMDAILSSSRFAFTKSFFSASS